AVEHDVEGPAGAPRQLLAHPLEAHRARLWRGRDVWQVELLHARLGLARGRAPPAGERRGHQEDHHRRHTEESSAHEPPSFVESRASAGVIFRWLASGLGAPAPGRPCGSHCDPATACGAHCGVDYTPIVIVSKAVTENLTRSSWIRRMFEEGARLKQERGADKVFDFTLGNPEVEPPPTVLT